MVRDANMVVCVRCHASKQVSEMRRASRTSRGYYLYCSACDNDRRREQRAAGPKPRRLELHRKLPPYAELKRLYVNGLSYSDIAERFDVNRSTVFHTLKRRARQYGDPWPLPSRLSTKEKMSRTLKNDTVNPLLLIGLVWDYLEVHAAWLQWEATSHLEATGERLHFRRSPFGTALEIFCQANSFSRTYLFEIHAGRYTTVSRHYASRLAQAIGEPINPSLLGQRKSKYSGNWRRPCPNNVLTAGKHPSASTTPAPDAGLLAS